MIKIFFFSLMFLLTIILYLPLLAQVDTISSKDRFVDLSSYLEKPFTLMYGEKKAKFIRFGKIIFSPDGKNIAFSISDIVSGDGEQVWIMNLKTKRCRLVTECVKPDTIGIMIDNYTWVSNNSIKINLQRIYWPNQSKNRRVSIVADFDKSTVINEFPPANFDNRVEEYYKNNKSKYYELSFSKNSKEVILKNLSTGKTSSVKNRWIYLDDSAFSFYWSPEGKYFTFVDEPAHRTYELYIGITEPRLKIINLAAGSWEMFDYAMSPHSSEIAYPTFLGQEIYI
jgi:Tol biopolymer transport system component